MLENLKTRPTLALLLACLLLLPAAPVRGQNGRPQPAPPTSREGTVAPNDEAPAAAAPLVAEPGARQSNGGDPSRESQFEPDEEAVLAFKDASVEQLIPFIVAATGKVVIPVNMASIKTKSITVINEMPIRKSEAIDLVFTALRLNGVGVVEKQNVIILDLIDNLGRNRTMPVLTDNDDVMRRHDLGSIVLKIFKLQEVEADNVFEAITETKPDHATVTVDPTSNQIVVIGDIEYLQHLQLLISELDRKWVTEEKKTFRLLYADASEISDNIMDLFETSDTGGGQTRQPRRPTRGRQTAAPSVLGPGPQVETKVTVNVQQNTVTVSAAPEIIREIEKLITDYWDRPRSGETARVYRLAYTDPLRMREMLQELLGSGGSAISRAGRGSGGGSGGRADVQAAVSGIFRIEAYADLNALVVMSKTEENFDFLDQLIKQLDQKTRVGLPEIVQLKHANAVNLAEELNVLLAEAGANVTLQRPGTGLTGPGVGDEATTTGPQAVDPGGGGTINFPWQRGRQNEDQAPESSLIGKVRIVPIIRQNALAILGPPHYQEALREEIERFDRPSRQVMLQAIIAEVELNDDLILGLRFSNDAISASLPDYAIGGNLDFAGTENDPWNLFDTSILDVGVNLNVLIQALAQETNVRIMQEPRLFTADNEEAYFFDGQDIPFITSTVINNQGNPTNSFDYREVGVVLNVRPRITSNQDVDLNINLELSSIVQGQTLFGGAIVDRRQTATRVIVENGQTIVISGILREIESKITRKVPFFGDIPLLGELFKSRENTTQTTELIAFITPVVVDNPSENSNNFNVDELYRLEDLTRPVKEQAKEWGKHPDKYRKRVAERAGLLGKRQELEEKSAPPEDVPDEPMDPADYELNK